jgi:hypothetical protein
MAHVQSTAAISTSGLSLGVAYTGNVVAGNLLLIAVHFDAAQTFTTLTDSQGNSYSLAGSEVNNATLAQKSRVYYAIAGSSAACTVTLATSGSGSFRYVAVHEYSTTTTFDEANQGTGTGLAPASGALTVDNASSLLFGFAVCSGTGSAGGSATGRLTTNGDITQDETVAAGSRTATLAQTPSGAWSAHGAAFNSGGGTNYTATVPAAAAATASGPTPAVTARPYVLTTVA